jgi:hypothetical protein
MSNTAVQGSKGVERETGAVKLWCRAVDHRRTLFTASLAFSEVLVIVWVLYKAQVVVSGVVVARFVVDVDGDVVVASGGSGCEKQGWGVCWGAIVLFGSEDHCSRGAEGCFDTGDGAVVAIVDNVDGIDGGCVAVVSNDVAALGEVLGCLTRVCMAVSVVLGVVWVLKSAVVATSVWVPESFHVVASASFDVMAFATSVMSIRLPSSTDTQWL